MKTKQELLDHHIISESTLEVLIDIRDVLNKFMEQEGGYFSGVNIEESNKSHAMVGCSKCNIPYGQEYFLKAQTLKLVLSVYEK